MKIAKPKKAKTYTKILLDNAPELRIVSSPVTPDNDLVSILNDMFWLLGKSGGYALAAPQVGINIRLFIVNVGKRLVFINPSYISRTLGVQPKYMETCLSLPGQKVEIRRPYGIDLSYTDYSSITRTAKFSGLMARIIQHEIDHLDGKLMTDYLRAAFRDTEKPYTA